MFAKATTGCGGAAALGDSVRNWTTGTNNLFVQLGLDNNQTKSWFNYAPWFEDQVTTLQFT